MHYIFSKHLPFLMAFHGSERKAGPRVHYVISDSSSYPLSAEDSDTPLRNSFISRMSKEFNLESCWLQDNFYL